MTLAILAAKLKKRTKRPASQFRQLIRLVQPGTVFHWHRDLIRRNWTQENKGKRGRPRIDDQKEHLIVHLAKVNLRWGYCRIEEELKKLGFVVSLPTVRVIHTRLKHPMPMLSLKDGCAACVMNYSTMTWCSTRLISVGYSRLTLHTITLGDRIRV